MERIYTPDEIRDTLKKLPRVKLAVLPTPLQELTRLSRALGGPRIFIKRDDLTGLAFGGNKMRMFEYLLALVIKEGADCVIGGASVQSNYCRQLAAAGARLGLDVYLVLRRIRGAVDDAVQGNLLLDLLTGADVRIIDGDMEAQKEAMFHLEKALSARGRRPAVLRMAGNKDLTPDVAAYVECFLEIRDQCAAEGVAASRIYVSSYDSTQAGLELAKKLLGSDVRIVGISPARWGSGPASVICGYANQAAENLGLSGRVDVREVSSTLDYVGEAYGIPTEEGTEMIRLLARTEGLFLDPVYTGKAFACLRDHIISGEIGEKESVVFLHTGGTPALFAYTNELGADELKKHIRTQ